MAVATHVKAKDLRPGMVVEWWDGLALIVSQEIPAGTLPRSEAKGYCEPGLVYLKYQRDDRWLQTAYFTYTLIPLEKEVVVNTSCRVQVPRWHGKFLREEERVTRWGELNAI